MAPGRRTRALALPQGAGRAAVPSWCEGGDVFPPPHFRVLLPPRTHSSSRHKLRIPDLGGAPRRARSACTRGPRRPVARSVRGARRLLSLSSFPAFAQVGRLPPGHPSLPEPATSAGSLLQLPAARLEVGPRALHQGRWVDGGGGRLPPDSNSPLPLGLLSSRLWSCGEAPWVTI